MEIGNPGRIDYVVGSDRGIRELIADQEILPLLKAVVRAGAAEVSILDGEGNPLWTAGSCAPDSSPCEALPLALEGETVGKVRIRVDAGRESSLQGLAGVLADFVNSLLHSNLKRMLTTEIHTKVVNQSYEDLLEINRLLGISEGRYRALAGRLEEKVNERTKELERVHARLLQQETMASVGQLAAGVAHEINTPLGFIASNVNTLKKYLARYREMVLFYRTRAEQDTGNAGMLQASQTKWRDLKLDFISSDAEILIEQTLEGAQRVQKIVSDLKGFSHIDDGPETAIDINAEIDRTLNVLTHEIPSGTEIIRNYGCLPDFRCRPALICQVFLNIILNALQAKRDRLRLAIRTEVRDNRFRITFADNGTGIPADIQNRIFEPFYTTREVGAGKGMGLTVAYEIVTAHGGSIEVESEPGKGAVFTVSFPLSGEMRDG